MKKHEEVWVRLREQSRRHRLTVEDLLTIQIELEVIMADTIDQGFQDLRDALAAQHQAILSAISNLKSGVDPAAVIAHLEALVPAVAADTAALEAAEPAPAPAPAAADAPADTTGAPA